MYTILLCQSSELQKAQKNDPSNSAHKILGFLQHAAPNPSKLTPRTISKHKSCTAKLITMKTPLLVSILCILSSLFSVTVTEHLK